MLAPSLHIKPSFICHQWRFPKGGNETVRDKVQKFNKCIALEDIRTPELKARSQFLSHSGGFNLENN
jgi:hypothetical protein